jgi:hypothetical protein
MNELASYDDMMDDGWYSSLSRRIFLHSSNECPFLTTLSNMPRKESLSYIMSSLVGKRCDRNSPESDLTGEDPHVLFATFGLSEAKIVGQVFKIVL